MFTRCLRILRCRLEHDIRFGIDRHQSPSVCSESPASSSVIGVRG